MFGGRLWSLTVYVCTFFIDLETNNSSKPPLPHEKGARLWPRFQTRNLVTPFHVGQVKSSLDRTDTKKKLAIKSYRRSQPLVTKCVSRRAVCWYSIIVQRPSFNPHSCTEVECHGSRASSESQRQQHPQEASQLTTRIAREAREIVVHNTNTTASTNFGTKSYFRFCN